MSGLPLVLIELKNAVSEKALGFEAISGLVVSDYGGKENWSNKGAVPKILFAALTSIEVDRAGRHRRLERDQLLRADPRVIVLADYSLKRARFL